MKHILKLLIDISESRPMNRLPIPALSHELINISRAVFGPLHSVAGLEKVIDIGELNARIRRLAVSGNLPKQHTVSPYVRFGREFVVGEAFGSRPFDGELGADVSRVRLLLVVVG